VLIDPAEQTATQSEGCLSIPGVHADIRRPLGITIEAVDAEGNPVNLTDAELPARIWQHETDHLDGVLILDRMSRLDKIAHRRILKDLEAEA